MKIIIHNSSISFFRPNGGSENIFILSKFKEFQSKAGIFFYDKDTGKLYGGWINFSNNFIVETEIHSFKKYAIQNNNSIVQCFVSSLDQLYQIANLLGDSYKNWILPKEFVKTFPYESDFKEYKQQILKSFRRLQEIHQSAYSADSIDILNVIERREFDQIRQDIDFYVRLFSIVDQKDEFNFQKIMADTQLLHRELADTNKIISGIFSKLYERNVKLYQNLFDKVNNLKNRQIIKIHEVIGLQDEIESVFKEFDTYNRERNRLGNNTNQNFSELTNNFVKLRATVNEIYTEQKRLEQLRKNQIQNDTLIVNQLSQFNPGIPTQLTRIVELVKLDKIIVEESIKRVIDKNPKIGQYDALSQVFTPGSDIVTEKEKTINQLNQEKLPDYQGIVVDGNNVALDQLNLNNGDKAKVARLSILHKFLGQYFKKENIIIFVSGRFRHICDDLELMDTLLRTGIITQAPAERSDDMFVILQGIEKNYFLLSNDRYRKEKEKYPELATKIDDLRIGFSWIENQNTFQLDEKFYQILQNTKK